MNLREGIEIFLARLCVDGREHKCVAENLHRFSKLLGDIPLDKIDPQSVLPFLDGPRTSSSGYWHNKYSALRRFFEFWSRRGEFIQSCMPHACPFVGPTCVPHIYTRAELLSLLRAIKNPPYTGRVVLHPQTMRAFVLMLYGTGARVGEVRALATSDVDLRAGFVNIGNEKFGRARKIPLNRDLVAALRRYSDWKRRVGLDEASFFTRIDRRPIDSGCVMAYFNRARLQARVVRHHGGKPLPSMRDLRPTFAVHRITSWIKSGVDLNRMLPALSAYMGQVQLTASEEFLRLTPERFRKELDSLSPKRKRKHWRDDSTLIGFLTQIGPVSYTPDDKGTHLL